LLARLEAGEAAVQVCQALNLSPAEFLAALGRTAFASDDPDDWPGLVQSQPNRPWLAGALGESACAGLFPRAPRAARLALAAGLLQIHDFWDASHQAAQQADDLGERGFSAYWHGIAHRREPDAGNAAYWFRRVGRHPVFAQLAQELPPLFAEAVAPLNARLNDYTPVWNPFTFIDFCTSARPGPEAALALKLQRLEMTLLLDATLRSVSQS
jgi:hypothetical protein